MKKDYHQLLLNIGNVKYSYDKLDGNSAERGEKIVITRVHTPVHGRTGISILDKYNL
ncbi:hypothetical protein [Chryseobacterium sp. CT-SW4]|uniref:hypothetical protein n=1 Tax=Chryseobacterium sp. SW-1 TaxID=3157343 RepID=UPI003B01DDCC